MLLGGIPGSTGTITTVFLTRHLSATVHNTLSTAGSLFGSMVFDSFGSFGAAKRPTTWLRLLSVALAFAGSALTKEPFGTETVTVTETVTETETEAEAETETGSALTKEPFGCAHDRAAEKTAVAVLPETEAQAETEADTEAQAEAEADTETETEIETETGSASRTALTEHEQSEEDNAAARAASDGRAAESAASQPERGPSALAIDTQAHSQ